jgi:hypothetical protein
MSGTIWQMDHNRVVMSPAAVAALPLSQGAASMASYRPYRMRCAVRINDRPMLRWHTVERQVSFRKDVLIAREIIFRVRGGRREVAR